LRASEAIAIATEWVEGYAARDPDFRGAHLMGNITRMSPDETFPADSDVDMMLVVARPTITKDPLDEFYRGLAIEAGLRGVADYETPEQVLANPEIADHIAVGAIIADPTGLLASLQPAVAREFPLQRWVTARCDDEKGRFHMYLGAAKQTEVPLESMVSMTLAVQSLTALIAVALLVPPTHRKCLVQLREQLRSLGRQALYPKALDACGLTTLKLAGAQRYADEAGLGFDRALEVRRTPAPFDFKLRPHLRPYVIDGSQSMIDRGDYREAMPWIGAGIFVITTVLLNDAPEHERPRQRALARELADDLGFGSASARAERAAAAAELGVALSSLADEIVASRPDPLVTA
jgi:hypothetical protein